MLNLVKCCYQSGCSVKDAIRKYSYQKHNMKKCVCSTQVMKRIINKFENTGNVHYKLNGGRTSKTNDAQQYLKFLRRKNWWKARIITGCRL